MAYKRAAGFIFISGRLPRCPDGSHDSTANFNDQVRRALANVADVLTAAGIDWFSVQKVTAYVVGAHRWPAFDHIYSEILGTARPARTVIPVCELHHGYLVEIDAIAFSQYDNNT